MSEATEPKPNGIATSILGTQLVLIGGFVYLSDFLWGSPSPLLLIGVALMGVGLGLGVWGRSTTV